MEGTARERVERGFSELTRKEGKSLGAVERKGLEEGIKISRL